ncbi:CAP domain-containing protein [Halalkalibacter nanhaiisediminis]|nr:CAP domain-containing protein [Halalkalibacter nanhaiisediminis]
MFGVMIAVVLLIFLVTFETTFEDEIKERFDQPPILSEIMDKDINDTEPLLDNKEESPVSEEMTLLLDEHEYFIGMTVQEVIDEFGEPDRKDLSAYGYEWWIYPLSKKTYMQIGVEKDQVVTVFLTGDIRGQAFSLGETYQALNEKLSFQERVDVSTSEGVFQFQLSSEDLRMRPLTELDGQWIQLYFDTFTGTLSSIRMMTNDVLLMQQPYSVTYRGTLPERPELSAEQWVAIEAGDARQIFDFTNIIRERHELEPFKWEEDVAGIAYLHSRDMSIHNYFSHTSPTYGELVDRFENGEVRFSLAGENIAAKYVDGVAAVEGWLNSEGHRINLLHEEFTHLGVGVYQDYYTQNFMTPRLF